MLPIALMTLSSSPLPPQLSPFEIITGGAMRMPYPSWLTEDSNFTQSNVLRNYQGLIKYTQSDNQQARPSFLLNPLISPTQFKSRRSDILEMPPSDN